MGSADPTRMKLAPHGSFGVWRVGSDRVNKLSNLAGRVGSGQEASKSHGSGRVGSRRLENFAGRVGSADRIRPDPDPRGLT